MFKVYNKDTSVFIVNFEHISHHVLVFSIVNFEHVVAGWVGTGYLKIYKLMKWQFYLTEPSKTFFETTFHMKLSSAMTEIHLG